MHIEMFIGETCVSVMPVCCNHSFLLSVITILCLGHYGVSLWNYDTFGLPEEQCKYSGQNSLFVPRP